MPTFAYRPNTCRRIKKPRVKRNSFGNGYEQRVADGLNTKLKVWDLSWTDVPSDEADPIDTFFDTQGSVTSFTWVAPDGTTGLYVVDQWDRQYNPEDETISTISAQFREVVA